MHDDDQDDVLDIDSALEGELAVDEEKAKLEEDFIITGADGEPEEVPIEEEVEEEETF